MKLIQLGQGKNEWAEDVESNEPTDPIDPDAPIENPEQLSDALGVSITVEKYGRAWAVYFEGDLLCVTQYEQAKTVRDTLLKMQSTITGLDLITQYLTQENAILTEKLEAAMGKGEAYEGGKLSIPASV